LIYLLSKDLANKLFNLIDEWDLKPRGLNDPGAFLSTV
jgi:hypothetical protein